MVAALKGLLGAATALLVAAYVTAAVVLSLPDGAARDGAALGLYVGFAVQVVLLLTYVGLVLGRSEWTWQRRAAWAGSFYLVAPVSMPVYFLRHLRH